MKTYKKTIDAPRLVISHDIFASNPRRLNDSLGYFITTDREYISPDEHATLECIIKETGNEAKNQEDHMVLIKKEIEEKTDQKVLAIYPITKYEHSGIVYKLGAEKGFDSSNNGYYIITDYTLANMPEEKNEWERIINSELEEYNRYANGEIYTFELYDEDGEYQDGGGDYTLEAIEGGLPDDFKGENINDYINDK